MTKSFLMALCLQLPLWAGCGGGGTGPQGTPDMAGAQTLSGTLSADRQLSGTVTMTGDTTVPAGVTLTLAAGTTLVAMGGKGLGIQGTLLVQGSATAPVSFQSLAQAGASDWGGIIVEHGGSVTLTYAAIHDAITAFSATSGASYNLDHLTVDTSSDMLSLLADGTITHSQFHGLGATQPAYPVLLVDASPHISNSLFDKANPNTDLITVSGTTSAAVFDHVEVTDAHCAFHFNQGNQIVISNSYVHGSVYGLMVEASVGTQVKTSNFNNTVNIGVCGTGGSVTASGDYFTGAAYDQSCATQPNQSPAASALPNVGPQP